MACTPSQIFYSFISFLTMMLNVIVFGQCSMNCCQWGSLTPTGRDKETDGSRLCGLLWLWPDCTALFTVGGVCVHVCSWVHACTSKCICVMTEKEMQRPYVHNRHFTFPLLGSCWWISSQSKQESKHTDGSACSYSRYQTMLEFNYNILYFCPCTDAYIVIKQSLFFLVFLTCWHITVSFSCWSDTSLREFLGCEQGLTCAASV